MVIGIIGESCTGKSTLAERLQKELNAEVFSGKDYLRLAKNENIAKSLFRKKLEQATDSHMIYVIAEKEHLALLPDGAIRILVTADLDTIKERFAKRMHGNLPAPVATMLKKARMLRLRAPQFPCGFWGKGFGYRHPCNSGPV